MAADLRQVLGAFLTFSMFVMLGNMIKRDHIDPLWDPALEQQRRVRSRGKNQTEGGPWREEQVVPKWCWKKSSDGETSDKSNGYIFFSLSLGPEFHPTQVANAVTVAKYFGATLVVPDIRTTDESSEAMKFEEIYDVDNFVETLEEVAIKVEKNPPAEILSKKPTIVRVPDRISIRVVASKLEPIFLRNQNLKIVTDFNLTSRRTQINRQSSNESQCLAMFEALKFQPKLQELLDSVMETLHGLSYKMGGRFIAVDLGVEARLKKQCRESDLYMKHCFDAKEIGAFLTKIGFNSNTTLYLTQKGWSEGLNPLRNIFPGTYTKDVIILDANKKDLYKGSAPNEYDEYIDYYICIHSDVFVAGFPASRFYGSVVGKRIGFGKLQVLVPSMDGSDKAEDYISPYIIKKGHYAYSCFC